MKIYIGLRELHFQGIEELEERSFNIISKHRERVGFIYELLDDKGQEARLKVVVDQNKYVNLLYFNSKKYGEHTFFLAEKSDAKLAQQKSHFTPKTQYFVRGYAHLIGRDIFPFQRFNQLENETVVDISKQENCAISFREYENSFS